MQGAGDWKASVLSEMGIPALTLSPQEWVLLLLLADGGRPMMGELDLHLAFFMMQVTPFRFELRVEPELFYVHSSELSRALEELAAKGLVRREASQEAELISLTERGLLEARSLAERVRRGWVFVDDVVVKEGSKVLSDLEALKKTYNGKSVYEWMKIIVDKVSSPESPFDQRFTSEEIESMKKILSQALKRRQRPPSR